MFRVLQGEVVVQIIDISWPITEAMTAYKNKSVVCIKRVKEFPADGVRESVMTFGSHTGTHIDAPSHFLQNGVSLDQVPLSTTIGPCVVLDMTHCRDQISYQDVVAVDEIVMSGVILLCKTTNSALSATQPFEPSFVYIDQQAAQYLVTKRVKAVGVDYLGIERNQKGHETHKVFMQNGVTIIEGLRLEHVAPGAYTLYCLPLAVPGIDGCPARAVLVTG